MTQGSAGGAIESVAKLLQSRRGRSPNVLVVGDAMLDRDCVVEPRLRRGDPVPVYRISETSHHLGGGGNVADACAALGADVFFLGLAGKDEAGSKLRTLFNRREGLKFALVQQRHIKTTLKIRLQNAGHDVIRIDDENLLGDTQVMGVDNQLLDELCASVAPSAIIFADYCKGVFQEKSSLSVLRSGRCGSYWRIAQTKRQRLDLFSECDFIILNEGEALEAGAVAADMSRACIFERVACRALVVTRAERGVIAFLRTGESISFPSLARHVVDVNGAGDCFTAGFSVALGLGAPVAESIAAGLLVAATRVERGRNYDMMGSVLLSAPRPDHRLGDENE
ncbi:MAG: bifunctional heptose 7-phosphate kinase/heptose 1-phosphate adenyltransferase [Hyphomicrobiaceae bacterium]